MSWPRLEAGEFVQLIFKPSYLLDRFVLHELRNFQCRTRDRDVLRGEAEPVVLVETGVNNNTNNKANQTNIATYDMTVTIIINITIIIIIVMIIIIIISIMIFIFVIIVIIVICINSMANNSLLRQGSESQQTFEPSRHSQNILFGSNRPEAAGGGATAGPRVHIYIYTHLSLNRYIYIYTHICISISLSLSIYIYIHTYTSISISLSLYIYIYI